MPEGEERPPSWTEVAGKVLEGMPPAMRRGAAGMLCSGGLLHVIGPLPDWFELYADYGLTGGIAIGGVYMFYGMLTGK